MLDALDRSILEELNIDARRSHREIAHRLKVSPTTVGSRVARLEEEGVIHGYIPLLDDELLGWDLWAAVGIRISKGRLREVEERLARDPHAYAIYDVTGDYDALLIGRFRDRRDLDRFVKHALQDPHVERSNTQVVLNRVKEDRRVPVVLRGGDRPLAEGEPAAGPGRGNR
jgi:DNA-binding Lrp family transcriptional regulator